MPENTSRHSEAAIAKYRAKQRRLRDSQSLFTSQNQGLFDAFEDDPFAASRVVAERAPEAAGIASDIFGGIFGEGGTDFGGIAEGLLGKMEGVSRGERDVAFRGIDDEAARATANVSNRLSQFGDMDPEQFTRVAGDIDVGRLRARGETEARFAGMDREMNLGILRTLPGLMGAQQSQRQEFGDTTMNILNAAPLRLTDNNQGQRRRFF